MSKMQINERGNTIEGEKMKLPLGCPIGVKCKVCGYFTINGHLIIVHEKETGHKEWEDAYLVAKAGM